jgi:3-deoxy-D-manno-octulosonate 8-phosphate phosphatase (KDO 8-P phosphatase)
VTSPSLEAFQSVRLVALDIDGVLSDGTVSLDEHGNQRRAFDIKDGLGIVRLVESGRRVVVISSSASTAGVERLVRLGIDPVHTGVPDKLEVLHQIVSDAGVSLDQVAYMGDDLPDVKCLDVVGISTAPADAVEAVRSAVDYVATAAGGRGAVRELSDIIVDGVWPGGRGQ